ncbi:MAG TPA: hypothetical protein VFM49_04270, partial [Chloroflexia bacterium]|nr:hypothetical protein [Chloroflexia bacterium]
MHPSTLDYLLKQTLTAEMMLDISSPHRSHRPSGTEPADKLLRIFDDIPVERAPGVQQKLDIAARSRTSLFPWRGQFSPEFIEFMLGQFAPSGGVVADPFVGSGTT